MSSNVPASHTAFHAHLDACERCRSKPFDLCSQGGALLQGIGRDVEEPRVVVVLAPDARGLSGVWFRSADDIAATRTALETPFERIQRLLNEQLVGLGPLPRAVKLEKIARDVAKFAAKEGDAKAVAFWTARADQALRAAEQLARENARTAKRDGTN